MAYRPGRGAQLRCPHRRIGDGTEGYAPL